MESEYKDIGLFWQPLGGNNNDQISGHCYCYTLNSPNHFTRILIDLGKFDNHQALGVRNSRAAVPDIVDILQDKTPPSALLLTHSHPDHMNGIVHYIRAGYKLPKIYGGRYTKLVLDELYDEFKINPNQRPEFEIISVGDCLIFNDFDVEVLSSSHTCFDTLGFIIKTPYATVYHTGDMKLDASTCFRKPTSIKRLKQKAKDIDWVIVDFCDVIEDGYAITEKENLKCFYSLLKNTPNKKVFIPVYPTHLEMYIITFLAALKYKRDVIFYGNHDFYCYLDILKQYGIDFCKLAKKRIKVYRYPDVNFQEIGKNFVVIGTFNDVAEEFSASQKNSFGIITAKTFFNPLKGKFNAHNIPFTDINKHNHLQACGHGHLRDIEALNKILPNSGFIPTHCPVFVIDYFRKLASFLKLKLIKQTPHNGQIYKLKKDDACLIAKKEAFWLVSAMDSDKLIRVKQKPTSGEGFLKRTISRRKCLKKFQEYLHKRKSKGVKHAKI